MHPRRSDVITAALVGAFSALTVLYATALAHLLSRSGPAHDPAPLDDGTESARELIERWAHPSTHPGHNTGRHR